MKIYTSYWAMVRNFPPNLVGLSTCVFNPKWRPLGQDKKGVWVIDCPPLKPGPTCSNLCRGACDLRVPDSCAFLKAYRKQLDTINFQAFYANLERLATQYKENESIDVNFALIVFETRDNKCSERWPLQDWLRDNGVEVEEWRK